jgi:hypothetical protein
MSHLAYLLAGLFLPLFPLSMLFNFLYSKIRHPLLRGVLLLTWPQLGLIIVSYFDLTTSHWVFAWAIFTSLLYAFRALALRELGLWTSFLGTSSWALIWILLGNNIDSSLLICFGFGISAPLVLMALLGAGLEQRFGAAYLGLYGGLAQSIPRFTGVLVVVVLAIVATPVFPTFFAMLLMIFKTALTTPYIAVGVGLVWLLWSWAGARLLQGLIVGPQRAAIADLDQSTLWLYITALTGLLIASVYCAGAMS